jgi:hypothetical protein
MTLKKKDQKAEKKELELKNSAGKRFSFASESLTTRIGSDITQNTSLGPRYGGIYRLSDV